MLSALRSRRLPLALLLALTAALVLASCDTAAPGTEDDASDGGGLRVVQRLPGGALMGKGSGPVETSPYTCRISTLRSEETVATGAAPYGYHTIYLHFPPGLERKADGERQHNAFIYGDLEAPAYAERIAAVLPEGASGGQQRGVRMARCTLPGGPKQKQLSRRARKMVEKHLRTYPRDSWVGRHQEKRRKGQRQQAQNGRGDGGDSSPARSPKTTAAGGQQCREGQSLRYIIYFEYYEGSDQILSWEVIGSYCVDDDKKVSDGGGGGGGGGGGNLDPDEVSNPCESDDPPDYCSETGSCFDKDLSKLTQQQQGMILALEGSGTLSTLWKNSNYDPNRPGDYVGDRREKFGIVRPDEFSDGFRAYALPENLYESTNTRLYVSPSRVPDDAVAVIHTHPFDYTDKIRRSASVKKDYDGTLSSYDLNSLEHYGVSQGIMIDAEEIVFFDENSDQGGTRIGRCGF